MRLLTLCVLANCELCENSAMHNQKNVKFETRYTVTHKYASFLGLVMFV